MDVIRIGINEGEAEGYAAESRAFAELSATPQSKGLISLFEGQIKCKENRFGKPNREVQEVGVVGIGLMGAGIGIVSLEKGFRVTMKARNKSKLDKCVQTMKKYMDTLEKKKQLTR